MFLEIQSGIADFLKNMVLLWQGHDFRGFRGLQNHHFRRSKASKNASDERRALGEKKNRGKIDFGGDPIVRRTPREPQKCFGPSPGTLGAQYLGGMEGTLGMFFEIQSRIADFLKIMVFLWRGHDFRGFGGLENHHFRRSKASKKASAEKWALGRKKNRSKTGFGARPGGGKRSETLRDRL